MQESELVFGYGSNMVPSQMRERCPESDLSWFVARAEGYALCFPRKSIKRHGGVGSTAAAANESVWGVVFSVTKSGLTRLDDFEGVPANAYRRERCTVKGVNNVSYLVWTYFANPQEEGPFLPSKDYIRLYIKGAEYFGLPAEYIAMLRNIKTRAEK